MLQTDDLAAAVAAEEPTPSSEDCCDSTVDEMSTLGPSKSVTTTSTLTSVGLLKREAQTVLSLIKKKPIVAIDLDYTVRRISTHHSAYFLCNLAGLWFADLAGPVCRPYSWTVPGVQAGGNNHRQWEVYVSLVSRQKKFFSEAAVALP